MAKYSNVVEYNIVTDVDSSGIVKLQNELTKLKQSLKFDKVGFSQLGFDDAKIDKSIKKVNQLQNALTAAFNPKIGTLDLSKLNASLQKEHTSLQMIVKDWEQMGSRGTMAISNLSNALLSMNKGAMNVNTTLSKIANTFSNTVRWGITASIFQEMMSSVQGAVSYMKDLDESLTNIQMVTNSSKEDMRELAQYANNAAQALGSTTTDYTNAVKVFVQEGFSESESKQYANLSTKLANVSEQNTATTSDQITAYRNAFQLDYEQTVAAMDKVANVANNTASNVNELMTASQRAASVAQAVGSSQDSFLAAIATIESVTRQSAEEIGNGLKTIYQRFADIKVSGSTDDGVDYGQYAEALKSVGVDVLDVAGQFKGMDQILSELQDVWSSLDDTMKIAVGEKVAGKFQYNRFAALMNNPEYYQKALSATQGANGMMDQMNDIYMQGIEGRLNTLQTAGEQVMSTLFDQDSIEPVIEQITEIVNGFNDLVDAAGGLSGVLQVLSAIMLRTFSTQIAGTITNIATAIKTVVANSANANQLSTTIGLVGLDNYSQTQQQGSVAGKLASNVAGNYDQLSIKTQEKIRDLSQQIVELEEQKNEVIKKQQSFYGNINKNATEEVVLLEQQTEQLVLQMKELRKKELAGTLTGEEEKQLKALREQALKLKQIKKDYEEIKVACADYIKKLDQGEKLTEEQVRELELWRSHMHGLGIEVTELTQLLEEAGVAEDNLSIADKMADDIAEMTNFEAGVNSVVKTLSSVTSIAFGFSMVSDMFKTLGDDSATLEEKLDAIIMNGTMGLTMLLPGIMSLAAQINNLTTSVVAEAFAWDQNTAAKLRNNMTTRAWIGLTLSAIAVRIRDTAATIAHTVAETASNVVKTIRNILDGNWIAIAGAIVVALGAAAIAIAAVTKAWIDNFGELAQANKEYERQNELLAETKRNYQDIQEKVDSLKQSLDSISKTTESLEDLTKGTKKWKEAVRELNQEILQLLQTYPELAQYVSNEDGVLTLDNNGIEKFYQEQIDKASHLNDVNSIQQAKTLQAENNLEITKFATDHGLSKADIEDAVSRGAVQLEGQSAELNIAFAQLQDTVQANNTAIDSLNSNIGILNTNFENYSTKDEPDVDAAKAAITEKFGFKTFDEYGNETGTKLDFSAIANNQELWSMVAEATGKQIIGAEETGFLGFGDGIKFKTADGGEKEYSSEQLLELLSTSEATLEAANSKLQENIDIYTAFGARYDETSKQFIDRTGKTVTSLKDLNLTTDQLNAIEAFRTDKYNEVVGKENEFSGSIGEFAQKIAEGSLSVEGFTQKLNAFDLQQKEENVFNKLGDLAQTKGVNSGIGSNQLFARNIQLTSDQAQEIMSDMMKKLNESSLSDEEKLQLMDKIDWTMPVEDILANIQHAIDTGNIETAFLNESNIEDDSERKEKVLEEYSIDDSTLDAYKEQLKTTDALAKKQQELNKALEDANYKGNTEDIKKAKKALADFNDESEDLAVDLAQTQKGLESLSSNMAKYNDILKKGDKTTLEYAEALGAVKKALAETLNVSEENISNSLIQNNLEAIERLASGDIKALNELRAVAGQDIVMGFYMSEDSNLTEEHLEYLKQKAIEVSSLEIEVGADVNDEEFVNTLNEMLKNGELTRNQVNEYLHGIGVEPHMVVEEKPAEIFSTRGMFVRIPLPWGSTWDIAIPEFSLWGNVAVPQITTEGSSTGSNSGSIGTGLKRTASPTAPSGQTGISPNYIDKAYQPDKSSNKNKDNDEKQPSPKSGKDYKNSEWDYLTDITNDLDRASAAMEKLAKLEDRLYGKTRISNLRNMQKEYTKYLGLLKEELSLTQAHAKKLVDTKDTYDENGNLNIVGYANKVGKKLTFDESGNISNGREIELALRDRANAAIAEYNRLAPTGDVGNADEIAAEYQKDYDDFMKVFSEYGESLNKIDDVNASIQEYKEKIQDATDAIVDSIQDGIDDVTKAINNQRDFNKLYREWMNGGYGYTHISSDRKYYSEGLQGLFSTNVGGSSVFDAQVKNLSDRIVDFKNVFDKNRKNADDEKLSEADARENLQNAVEKVITDLQDMVEYYEGLWKTLEEAVEKMDDVISDRLKAYDRIVDTIDSRLDQIKLLFGDNYGAQTKLYNERISANMGKLTSINEAIKAKQATVEALEKLEASNKELSKEQRKDLKEARESINDLQEQQIKTETSLLQDIANRLESQSRESMNEMVKKIFGGKDVDWISQQWELAEKTSSLYLDDYNKAMELQKLQLKYQDLLNNSQNSSAIVQQYISNQMSEQLDYLRTKTKLTEYDVKYAEKQLDILQKQIALEETRNNKSQMRLQRNAAGNYDFVYAVDEDAVNNAAQALLDAQQEAYNMSKEMYTKMYEEALNSATQIKELVVGIAIDANLSTTEKIERIKEVLANFTEYTSDIGLELNDISINLYNDFISAAELVSNENLGNLENIYREIAAQAGVALDEMGTRAINATNAIDTAYAETSANLGLTWNDMKEQHGTVWDSMQGQVTGVLGNINTSFGTLSDNIFDTYLPKIKQGTDLNFAGNEGIKKIIGDVLLSIDDQFVITQNNSIRSMTTIKKATETAVDEMAEHITQYEKNVKDAVKAAGSSIKTFVDDSVNEARTETQGLDADSKEFKKTLKELKKEITDNATAIEKWTSKISTAMEKTKTLVTRANKLIESLGGETTAAANAASETDNFSDSATKAGDSALTMAEKISSAYEALKLAADAAVAAYERMKNASDVSSSAAKSNIEAVASVAKGTAGTVGSMWEQLGTDVGNGAETMGEAMTDIKDTAKDVNENAKSYLSDFWQFLVGVAEKVASKVQGIIDTIGRIGQAINNLPRSNVNYVADPNALALDSSAAGYVPYASGGYTGSWPQKGVSDTKDGRLAILHQKELVLNATDTENMLSAVEVVRDIMSGVNSLSGSKTVLQNKTSDTIEQRVEINATFPGVTEAIEIKQALEQLADNAYQVANTYKY